MSSAAERNCGPILEVLAPRLPEQGLVLEVGSGLGLHVHHYAESLPGLRWQPSEVPENLPALQQALADKWLPNLLEPIALDARQHPWPVLVDAPVALFSVNTSHIMNWLGVCALIGAAGRLLPAGGRLFLYGPFMEQGRHTGDGNRAFDASLRAAGSGMGLRDVQEITVLAAAAGLQFEDMLRMPANNRTLVYCKEP